MRSLTAALLLSLAAGCIPRAVPPPDLSLDPAQLLAQVRSAQARVHSVQGNARLYVRSPSFTGMVGQFVAAERPDRLRLETLDFFGNQAAVMVADGARFALYDAHARTVYVGAPTPANLARLAPIAMRAEDLVSILCGAAPILDGTPIAAEPARRAVRLRIEAGARTEEITVGAGAQVERARMLGREPGAFEVSFSERAPVEGVPFPQSVTLASDHGVRVELEWKDAEVNRTLDPALFRLEPPRGARVVELGDGSPAPGGE